MPKSKRAKVVHLSKVEKKGKVLKEQLFTVVRELADEYQYIFLFSCDNMRNTYLKDIRAELTDSRILFGKTSVMAKSLGSDESSEYLPNLSQLTAHLTGSVGLLFTNREPSNILDFFSDYSEVDFARAGTVADRDFTIPEGVVYSRGGEVPVDDDVPLPHSQETTVRKWGMPTRLDKGRVKLEGDYTVCREGDVLNSNQTALLKLFGVAMAEFKVQVKAYWSAATHDVTVPEQMEE